MFVVTEKTYQVKHYRADIAGYNVSQCVHVEAEPPGDPVTETKSVHTASLWDAPLPPIPCPYCMHSEIELIILVFYTGVLTTLPIEKASQMVSHYCH